MTTIYILGGAPQMKDQDLPLFAHANRCQILVFPLNANKKHVHQVASDLWETRNVPKQYSKTWHKHAFPIMSRLRDMGLSDDEITRELEVLSKDVEVAMSAHHACMSRK